MAGGWVRLGRGDGGRGAKISIPCFAPPPTKVGCGKEATLTLKLDRAKNLP